MGHSAIPGLAENRYTAFPLSAEVPGFRVLALALLAVGSLIQAFSYDSLAPFLVGPIFYIPALVILHRTPLGGRFEESSFRIVFAVCWFWAGVAAIYANQFHDLYQSNSDASSFYTISTVEASAVTADKLRLLIEGAGAVIVWRAIYDFFHAIGFEKARYIGIAVNVFLVAATSVVGVKMVRAIYGDDRDRLRRFVILFSLCGLFWLFAAVHLRDAAVLFAVSLLALAWTRHLADPSRGRLLIAIASTIVGFLVFGFLRAEFVFVPAAMMLAAIGAKLLDVESARWRKVVIVTVLAIGVTVGSRFLSQFELGLWDALSRGKELYGAAASTHAATSLGTKFIVAAPLPIRLVLGSIYLFIFPIPVWSGFQLESAYNLFKSFQALFMYGATPLFVLAAWRLTRRRALRTPAKLFVLFTALGTTAAVAGTSLETRHFGAFFPAVLALSVLPDLQNPEDRRAYRNLLFLLLGVMAMVHLAWIVLKIL